MKRFFFVAAMLIVSMLLAGCGTTTLTIQPPNGAAVAPVAHAPDVKTNVNLVLIQNEGVDIYFRDHINYISILKDKLTATNLYGDITTDAKTRYLTMEDVPTPQAGTIVVGMVMVDEVEHRPLGRFIKTMANYATLGLLSWSFPYQQDRVVNVSLTAKSASGPGEAYSAVAAGEARYTIWTFFNYATRNTANILRRSALTSAVNQMTEARSPKVKLSAR